MEVKDINKYIHRLEINVKFVFAFICLITLITQTVKFNNIVVVILTLVFILVDLVLKNSTDKLLIISIFTPGFLFKTLFLIYCAFLIVIKGIKENKGKILKGFQTKDRNIKLFLHLYAFMFLSFLINQFFSFNLISLPLIIVTFIVPTLSYFIFKFYFKEQRKSDEIINIYYNACVAQIIPVGVILITQLFKKGISLGDAIVGTFSDANLISICIIIAMIVMYFDTKLLFMQKLKYFIIYGFILSITDAKHIYGLGLIAVMIYVLFFSGILKKIISNRKIVVLLSVIFIIGSVAAYKVSVKYAEKNNLMIYINDNRVNLKWEAFKYTFSNIRFPRNIIGVGPGNFGSRAANALAKDTMYKGGSEIKLPSIIKGYTNPLYKPIAKEYSKEYFDNISYYSAILSYPFNSIVTIYGETGMVGLVFLFTFIVTNIAAAALNLKRNNNKGFGPATIILIFMVFFLLFFDNYLEKAELMISLMMLLALNMDELFKKKRI